MPGFCPNCLFSLSLRLQCTEVNLLLAMFEANTLQKSDKYFQMCFLCIPVHRVGYRVQKFMVGILSYLHPQRRNSRQAARAEKRLRELTRYQLELWEENPIESLCVTGHLRNVSCFFPFSLHTSFSKTVAIQAVFLCFISPQGSYKIHFI